MRKLLLASVATLASTGGLLGTAVAQPGPISPITVPPQPPTFSQGQVATTPSWSPPAGANNNNNYQAPMLPGALANPTPGTIVVHLNGKVQVDVSGFWTGADQRLVSAPAGTAGGATISPGTAGGVVGNTGVNSGATGSAAIVGNNGAGTVKLMPQEISSFARIYAGADGMATNGLRYGAAIEIRENFTGQISGNGSTGASGYSSLATMYVRRAFTYVASDQVGILRLGMADGLIGIFDNGVTTFQFLPSGNLNGGDSLSVIPQNAAPTFVFMGQAGNEYDNTKAVYLSPQIAGFDFGFQYAPNTSNGFGMGGSNNPANASVISAGTGTGLGCTVANSGCPSLSSGPGAFDGSRVINQTAVGVRYQGLLGGVGVLAYGVYMFSQTADYTGIGPGAPGVSAATIASVLGNTVAGSKYTGKYNGLNLGNGGVALSYAGFTLGGNVIGGQDNGQLGAQPKGGAPMMGVLAGLKYTSGPFVAGIVGEEYWEQGSVNLSGLTQLRARAVNFGASYQLAPGYTVFGEYMWADQYQGARNFVSGALGSNANNNLKMQGILLGNVVNF